MEIQTAGRTVKELFAEAVEITRAAQTEDVRRRFDETVAFVEDVTLEQRRFADEFLKKLEHVVIPAAAGGCDDAVAYEFKGGDTFGNYSVLFMLLGGHDRERREELEAFGFEPLLGNLRRSVRPFDLVHEWDRETNANRLVVSWSNPEK